MAATNVMPHNRDAEMALLGCMLIDNETAADIVEPLKEEDFYQESNRYVLTAMKHVFSSRKPIDLVTLSDQLESEGTLEKAGGITYLTELAQITPSAANYKSYFDIVKRDSLSRKLIRASQQIIQACASSTDEKGTLAFAEKSIYDISRQTDRSSLQGMQEGNVVDGVLKKFESLSLDKNAYRGVETGFRRLDQMTNGLQKSDLIVLAARPGMGKTSFSMNIVEHAALCKGKVCAVFSLEMPRSQIVQRLLCSYANVSMGKALSGNLAANDWKKLIDAAERLKEARIYVDDSSRVTPAEIESKCRRLKAKTGALDLIMIDYIQLMSGGSSTLAGQENRQQEIASITRDLKIMAKELEVPVIALSQLRRMQTKEPQLSDLRESGAIEQDADIVMFISRPEAIATKEELESGKIVKGAAEIIIAKHRNGEQGRIQLKFIGESTKFVDEDAENRPEEPPQFGRPRSFEEEDDVLKEAGFNAPPPEEEEPPFDM